MIVSRASLYLTGMPKNPLAYRVGKAMCSLADNGLGCSDDVVLAGWPAWGVFGLTAINSELVLYLRC